MPEPSRNADAADGPLAEATQRLEQALQRLDAALCARAPPSPIDAPDLQAANAALAGELAQARAHAAHMEAAATRASEAVERAAAQVQRALDADDALQAPAEPLDGELESEAGSGDGDDAIGAAVALEEPTA